MRYVYIDGPESRVYQWMDTDERNYVLPDLSKLHECTDEEWALDKSQPWMLENGGLVPFVAAAPDLAQVKGAKFSEMKAAFEAAVKAGFTTTSGITMNSDLDDIQRLKSAYDLAVLIGAPTMPIVVDFANESHLDLPLADAIEMIIELAINYQSLYARKQTRRQQAAAATTRTALSTIVW